MPTNQKYGSTSNNEDIESTPMVDNVLNQPKIVNTSNDDKPIERDEVTASSTKCLSWRNAFPQIIACCIAHSLVIQAGVNMAFSAVLLPELKRPNSSFEIDIHQESWIASLVTVSLPVGSLATGPIMDKFGRRFGCLLTCVPFILSWLLTSVANSVAMLYVARLLAGAAGGLSTAAIVYVSEVSHPTLRPMLLCLNSVFVSFGILLTCIFGLCLSWRTSAMLYGCMSVASFCLVLLIPESPHWFAVFGPKATAQKNIGYSLRWLYRNPNVYENEFDKLVQAASTKQISNDIQIKTIREKFHDNIEVFKQPDVWRPVLLLAILFLLQQVSGAYVVIFYAIKLFKEMGSHLAVGTDETISYICLVLLGSIRFVMSVVVVGLSKKFGRRFLLKASGAGMSLSFVVAVIFFHWNNQYFLVACVLMYVCFSALGYLVIPWTLIGELLPIKVRGVLGGAMVAVAYLLMFLVVKVFPYILHTVGAQIVLASFAFTSLLGVAFVHKFLPETLGKSFREIEDYFNKR